MVVFIFFRDGKFVVAKCWWVGVILFGQERYFGIDRCSSIDSNFNMKAGICVGGDVLLSGEIIEGERELL